MYSRESHRHSFYEDIKSSRNSLGKTLGMNKAVFASLMFLTTLASSQALPLLIAKSPYTSAAAWINCILCALILLFTSPRPMMIGLFFAFELFFISFMGSPIIPALMIGTVFAIGTGSALFSMEKRVGIIFAVMLPLASYGLSFLASGNAFISAASLPLYIPAIVMSIASRKKIGKAPCILAPSIAAILLIATGILASIYFTFGSISLTVIYKAMSNLNVNLAAIMLSIIDHFGQTAITGATINSAYALIENILNLAPGLISTLCIVLTYISYSIRCLILNSTDPEKYSSDLSEKITASPASALIYVVCFLLSLTTSSSGGTSFVAVVAANLCYMLLPLLAFMGWEAIQKLVSKFFFFGLLISISLTIVLFWLSSTASMSVLLLLALLGAVYIILTCVEKWANENYSKGEANE